MDGKFNNFLLKCYFYKENRKTYKRVLKSIRNFYIDILRKKMLCVQNEIKIILKTSISRQNMFG